jgi:hypothetical protein
VLDLDEVLSFRVVRKSAFNITPGADVLLPLSGLDELLWVV